MRIIRIYVIVNRLLLQYYYFVIGTKKVHEFQGISQIKLCSAQKHNKILVYIFELTIHACFCCSLTENN